MEGREESSGHFISEMKIILKITRQNAISEPTVCKNAKQKKDVLDQS